MEHADLVAGLTPEELRQAVADRYGQVATHPDGTFNFPVGRSFAEAVGYPSDLLDALPAAASASFAGVTCLPGQADLSPGDVVVDPGCGAGLDSLIAAQAIGEAGHVHAVDVSDQMVALARANVQVAGAQNIDVRHGAVEALPLANSIAEVVLANGIFNLAPEKERAVAETLRVLKPGGRVVGAEVVLTQDIPRDERATLDDWFR